MATIVTRAGKGLELTHDEVDANFNNLNSTKHEDGDSPQYAGLIVSSGNVEFSDTFVLGGIFDSIDIDSGTIDGTAIGSTTPSTGAFTTLSTTGAATLASVDINGGTIDGATIGATTAAAGTFSALTATGAFTSLGIDDNATATQVTVTDAGVGVGVSLPTSALHVAKGSNSVPAAGASNAAAVFSNGSVGANNYGLIAGATTGGDGYIQAQRVDGTATTYNVLLQPNGGNVGIGTTAPAERLEVSESVNADTVCKVTNANAGASARSGIRCAADTATINVYATSAAYSGVASWGNAGVITTNSGAAGGLVINSQATSSPIAFQIGASEKARIDSSGNLLVGTTSTSQTSGVGYKYLASATAPLTGIVGANTSGSRVWSLYSTGAAAYRFYVDYAGQIHATSTSITAISDASLKDNVRDLDKGLETINALIPRRFDWKNGDGDDIMGFIAQEVEAVLPELVHDYEYSEGVTKKGLKMGDMIPSMVKAIQELSAKVEELEKKLAV